jgi:two-component system invasion response regulator UvrY
MTNKKIRILLADDHKMVRESWKTLLENNPRFQVVADSDNGDDAVEKAGQLLPDIALVDINMSPLNGFSVTEAIASRFPSVKVIGLSANNQPKYAHKMLELGASGYLTKTSSLEEIQRGIEEVFNGNIYICEEIKRYMSPE